MRRRRGIRWRRVVVWWVCLTVVMVGAQGAAGAAIAHWRHRLSPKPSMPWKSECVEFEGHAHRDSRTFLTMRHRFNWVCVTGMAGGYSRYVRDLDPTLPRTMPETSDPDAIVRSWPGWNWKGPADRMRRMVLSVESETGAAPLSVEVVEVRCPLASVRIMWGNVRFRADADSGLWIALRLSSGEWVLFHPVWIVLNGVLLSGLPIAVGASAIRFRGHIRARRDRCAWCGYSLAGIGGDAVCPECGEGR